MGFLFVGDFLRGDAWGSELGLALRGDMANVPWCDLVNTVFFGCGFGGANFLLYRRLYRGGVVDGKSSV